MMIKCPNCGSTAQVSLAWENADKYGVKFEREYVCGCGILFSARYEAVEIKPLGRVFE